MTTSAPTLGLTMIARDEEANLPHLLASIEGAFDQVALLDTGSQDRTVEVFEEWARAQDLPLGYKLDRFEWCDDFSAARNAADALLTTTWACWADCDDEIRGAPILRSLVASATPDVTGAAFPYDYFPGAAPGLGSQVYVRLARRGVAHWRGRVHEAQMFAGGRVVYIPGEAPVWVHRCESLAAHRARNMRILRAWIADEPENPTPLALLAGEAMFDGDRDALLAHCRTYLDRFGDRLTPEQLAAANWALDGIGVAVDATYPNVIGGADKLLRIVVGPNAGVGSQGIADVARAPKPLGVVSPGGDAVPMGPRPEVPLLERREDDLEGAAIAAKQTAIAG